MPAYAIREWRQEEKPKALPEQIIETIDSCEDAAKTAKSRLKKFLAEMGIQDILEMDYPLRKAYQNYLFVNLVAKALSPSQLADPIG